MRLFVDPMNPRRATDVLETRRLMMAREAGVKRAVYVSIVGMEGAAFPYYRGKLAAEAVVSSSV